MTQQFRFYDCTRNELSIAIDIVRTSRESAPACCDWLCDRLVDELGAALEERTSAVLKATDGAPSHRRERPFYTLPNWSADDLGAALVFLGNVTYQDHNYHVAKLFDGLFHEVVRSVVARLHQSEENRYGRSA
jgi:hypothetical protein